jgi:hypothetical protein
MLVRCIESKVCIKTQLGKEKKKKRKENVSIVQAISFTEVNIFWRKKKEVLLNAKKNAFRSKQKGRYIGNQAIQDSHPHGKQ